MLDALIDLAALMLAFWLGVALSPTVKAMLGMVEEDLRVEIGLLRADVAKLAGDLEARIKALEGRSQH